MSSDDTPNKVLKGQLNSGSASTPQKSLLVLGRDAAIRAAALLGISPPLHTGNGEAKDGGDGGGATQLAEDALGGSVHDAELAINAMQSQCDNHTGGSLRLSQTVVMDAAWIRKALKHNPNKTQRGLARAMGVDPTAVSRIVSGDRQIKASEIGTIEGYFSGNDSSKSNINFPTRNIDQSIVQTVHKAPDTSLIKVMGMVECGPDGWSLWNGEVVAMEPRPPQLWGVPNGYAVYVTGDSMEPRYEAGEIVFIHPGKPVLAGNYVVVQMQIKEDGDAPRAFLKRLVKRSGDKVTLCQFNPEKTFTLKASEILSIHRVVASGES